MNLKLSVRASLLALAALLTACGGGGGDDGECVLDIPGTPCAGSGSSGGAVGGGRKLTLTCPTTIVAGTNAPGFTAKLTNNGTAAIKDTFVALSAVLNDTPAGTVIGTNPDLSTNPGGANTNNQGVVPFTVNIPATGSNPVRITVRGANAPDSTTTFSAACAVTVTPNPIRLSIIGPMDEPSGAIELEAGGAKSGFVARLTDSTGEGIPDIELTLAAASDSLSNAGRITTPGTGVVTDDDGRVFFRYQSPTSVTDVSDINLTATGRANGFTANRSYLVRVFPKAATPPTPAPTLNLTAPSGQASGSVQLVSGSSTSGFFVQLLNGDGQPLVGQTVSFSISPGTGAASAKATTPGAVRANPPVSTAQPNVGRTNSEGRLLFTVDAPVTESTSPQVYTVTASTAINGTSVTGEFTVRVIPRGTPQLSLSAAGNQPSGSVTLASGERLNSFVATLRDGQGAALRGQTLSVTASRGRITFPAGSTTDIDGRLTFDYTAPTGVIEEEQILIKASATADGYQVPAAEYVVVIAPTRLEITGPSGAPSESVSVVAGKVQSGFRLRLTDGAARPLSGVAVTVRPRTSGGATSAAAAGTVTQSRSTTDGDGVITFSYTAPRPETQADLPILIGASARVGTDTITTDYGLVVVSRGVPALVLRGPADEPSGRIEVLADSIVAGLSVTFTDGLGEPLVGRSVTLTPSTGTITIADDSSTVTDSNGQIRFDYTAPLTVSARGRATITARASADGSSPTSTYQVTLVPAPPAAAAQLVFVGVPPTDASPAQKRTGYTVRFFRVGNEAIQGAPIRFTATNAAVAIVENGVERPGLSTGLTNSSGQLSFVLTPNSGSADTTIQVTAAYDGSAAGATSELTEQCQSSGACARTLNVTVRADNFQFTSPVFGTSVLVGRSNAQPLAFRWQTSAGAGVPACIDLDAAFQGSSDAPFGLVVSGDPTPVTQIRRVQLNSAGELQTTISVYSDRSGFVSITARENRNCDAGGGSSTGLTTSTGVQFRDQPGTANNHVDLDAPLKVQVSSDTGTQRRATITLDVRNNAFGRLDGEQVLFCIANPTISTRTVSTDSSTTPPSTSTPTVTNSSRNIDTNERVFPGGGTTNSEGLATTQYFIPALDLAPTTQQSSSTFSTTTTRSATIDVSGCVRRVSCSQSNDGQVCSTRTVQIVPATQ